MKFKALLLTVITAALAFAANATIHRVNSNTSIDADFSSLATAISSASPGDTLYVGGSGTPYGTITLNKELTIIGPGNFLDINDTTQAYQQPANINGTFTFTAGSAGSVVSGLYFTGEVNIDDDNIVIQNCRSYYGSTGMNFQIYSTHSNILITRNFIHNTYTGSSTSYRCISMDGNNNNILISNNVIIRGNTSTVETYGYSIYMPSSSSAVFQNNTVSGYWYAYNSVISGNLLYRGGFVGTGNTITNNVTNASQFGTSNGNQANAPTASMIAGTGTYDQDQYWYTSTDTTYIAPGNTITLIGRAGCENCTGSTTEIDSLFNLPTNITSATLYMEYDGSFNYMNWKIDNSQIYYWSGNSGCGASGLVTTANVLANVSGKSAIELRMDNWSRYNACTGEPHYAVFRFQMVSSDPYPVAPVYVGAFAGQYPYKLSSLPPIPSIFRANIPSSGVTSEPFIYDFSSKTNK